MNLLKKIIHETHVIFFLPEMLYLCSIIRNNELNTINVHKSNFLKHMHVILADKTDV